MSNFNYSLNQLTDSKTYTHIQLPIKNDSGEGKIGLIQDIDFGVMEGFGYTTDGYSESSQIKKFVSFVTTVDLLFKNLNTRINNLTEKVDELTSESLIASITTEPTAKQSLTYTGTSQVLITAGSASNGEMHYSLTNEGPYSTSVPQGINAGTYTVFYYAKGNEGYKDSAKSQLIVTIGKAPSLNTSPTLAFQSITHDGSSHNLINAGVANGGTMEYAVNDSSTTPTNGWDSNIPQRTDVGTYHIWYRINNVDSNHEPTNETYLGYVTIVERTIAVTRISLDQAELTVNANGTGTINVTNIEPSNATDKTITWSSSNTDVATVTASAANGQTATVTGQGSGNCMITAAAKSNPNVKATCSVTVPESYTWHQGIATEKDILSQAYINGLTYNKRSKPESNSTITLSPGYNTFMFPESWGIPKFGTDTTYDKCDHAYTVDELTQYSEETLINPEGKIFIAVQSSIEDTRYIKWQSNL